MTKKPPFLYRAGSGALISTARLQLSVEKCVVLNLRVFNGGAAAYLQVFDTATEPAASAVPSYVVGKIPADTGYESGDSYFSCTNGCHVALSSTPFVFTAVTADVAISAEL